MSEPTPLTVQANGLSFGTLTWGPADDQQNLLCHLYPPPPDRL